MAVPNKYNEVKFFLIAIAFISAFNYYITYTNIKLNWFLALTYTIDTIQGWLAWWAVRSIIIYLDRKLPYGDRPLQRILVQLLITTVTGMLIIILLTELVSWVAKGRPAIISFYSFDLFIIVIWFFVINGIYIGLHYYLEWKESEHRRQEDKKIRSGGITVKQGKQNLLIAFDEITGFYTDEGASILLNGQGKKYFPDSSLDKIEKQLPEEWFFRLNRQYILHRNSLAGFKRLNDGKIAVLVKPSETIPSSITVSRLKAAAFKNWFRPV
jgi:DNA-binding LytR/AlgR family response regulator